MVVPYIYNHELQLHLYQTILHKWVDLGITLFLLLLHKKEIYTMERKLQVIFTILVFCQTIEMDIELCANGMWMEGVIKDCYAGQAERIEGLACLSLRMTLEKPYVLASYCQCQPSKSEQLDMWKNLTACLLPSLAILDQSVKSLSVQFEEIKTLLKHGQEDKHGATL